MNYSFQQTQLRFTRYLRDPNAQSFDELPQERMQVYVELIYNNIENFLSSTFPVLRSIIPDERWHGMVRDFIRDHSAQTPYFLEISQEFLSYLLHKPHALTTQYPFLNALAHYEWVELALDIADEDLPEVTPIPVDIWPSVVSLSPLLSLLVYPWPVHKISTDSSTHEQLESHLLIYRNRDDQVKFMELSPVSSRFLQLCRDKPQSLQQQLQDLVAEGLNESHLRQQIPLLIRQLHAEDLVFFS